MKILSEKHKKMILHSLSGRMIVRRAMLSDIQGINQIVSLTYPEIEPYAARTLEAQIQGFTEGQFVIECDGQIVAFCLSFIVSEGKALKTHTWKEIIGQSFQDRHDPEGTYLYGMDICVHPDFRGKSFGKRLYSERRKLCVRLGLKGILFGARMPGFARLRSLYESPEEYINDVAADIVRDPTVSFQILNGFSPLKILRNYLPSDFASMGHGVLMCWRNLENENAQREWSLRFS